MSAPDANQLNRIIAAALTMPSSDNCQPFSFRWSNQVLEIHHDQKRAQHALNRGNHTSIISLGCLLELISIAAHAEAFQIRYELAHDFGFDLNPLWAKVVFIDGEQEESELTGAISRRESDRRLFQGGTFTDQVFRRIEADAAEFDKVRVRYASRFSPEFMEYYLKFEDFLWDHSRALKSVLKWIRFSTSAKERKADGVYWAGLGINYFEASFMRLLKLVPWFGRLVLPLGARFQIHHVAKDQLRHSAGLICFSVITRDREALIQIGRLGLRSWLRLNAYGYGVHPAIVSTISIYDELTGVTPDDVREEYRAKLMDGLREYRKTFLMSDDEIPVWNFRVGRSNSVPTHWRTKRFDVSEKLVSVPSSSSHRTASRSD